MSNFKPHQLEIRNFINKIKFEYPISVTLTEKEKIYGYQNNIFYIDGIRSVRNTKHFLNRLNQMIFKNSFRRFNKKLKSFVVMEGTSKNHHIHLILDKPHRIGYEEFCYLIDHCWSKTIFGNPHTYIQKITSNGWLNYITKYRSKTEFLTDIDWENTHIGS